MRMREGNATPISEAEVDAINTEEVVGGLEKMERKVKMEVDESSIESQPQIEMPPPPIPVKTEETEERRALRELLGEGASTGEAEEPKVDAIYSAEDARNGPIEEADAFKRDVDSRPDEVRFLSLTFREELQLMFSCFDRPLSMITLEFQSELSDSQCFEEWVGSLVKPHLGAVEALSKLTYLRRGLHYSESVRNLWPKRWEMTGRKEQRARMDLVERVGGKI